MTRPEEIDEVALLAAAQQAGLVVSAHQLKRWYRGGVMPRPRQDHPIGSRGSRSSYPSWAAAQLVGVARLHGRVHRLRDLVIAVWWEGLWADPSALREALVGVLDRLSAQAREIRDRHADPYQAADELTATLGRGRSSSGVFALVRKRLPGHLNAIRELLWVLAVLAFGGVPPWEEEDRTVEDSAATALELLSRGFGVTRAAEDRPLGQDPWLPAGFDLGAALSMLRDAGAFQIDNLARPVREATDDEIRQALRDVRLFTDGLAPIIKTVEDALGEDVAGLGSLRALATDTSLRRAAMIRTMLVLRNVDDGAGFAAIQALVEQVGGQFHAIARVRAAFPQYAQFLGPGFEERLASMPDDEAAAIRERLTLYLSEHPEIKSALGVV